METTYADSWSDMVQPFDMDLWVMKWWSAWPVFHSPVILPYILKTIWCVYIILWEYESISPEVWPDYYLTCNGSTRCVLDTDCMLSGWLLTRNTWKLTNNGCETVVHGTKLMMYVFWGIIKRGFPVSPSLVQKHSSNVLGHAFHFRFIRYLSVTQTVMSVNRPVHVW